MTNSAIERNPEAEKSYIRKAQALVGLERHATSRHAMPLGCLPYKRFPTSKKIKEALLRRLECLGGQFVELTIIYPSSSIVTPVPRIRPLKHYRRDGKNLPTPTTLNFPTN